MRITGSKGTAYIPRTLDKRFYCGGFMAYFSNGSEGTCFDYQCSICKYGQASCPIAGVQLCYNYDACNNEIASAILNDLVKNDGTCAMFKTFEKDLRLK